MLMSSAAILVNRWMPEIEHLFPNTTTPHSTQEEELVKDWII
jgi:hypothetical protein